MATIIATGGGAGGTGGSIQVKQYAELPSKIDDNVISVISDIPMTHYTIDLRQPEQPDMGEVWVMQYNTDKTLSEGKENGILNVRLGAVKQYIDGNWWLKDAYIDTDGSRIKISNQNPIYGFKIDKNNTDPNTRVEYLNDAVGMNPCFMDYTRGEFNYGSWKPFIDELCTPVMLNYDGTEAYGLDKQNQNQKVDGTASDISNLNFNGNAMVRWKKIYVKAYTDTNYNYIFLSFKKIDENYHCYAFCNDKGVEQDKIYVPMFKGFEDSGGRLRSIAGQTPTASISIVDSDTVAKSNGNGWQINYFSFWCLRAYILTLISKSTDSQSLFGNGDVKGSVLATGGLKDKGAFYGYNDNLHQVKCLYSEDVWGNLRDWLNGFVILTNGDIKSKNYAPYNFDNFTNYQTLETISSNKTGYLKNAKITENGILGDDLSGSSSTYFCDYLHLYASSDNHFPSVGGSYINDSESGLFYLYCDYSVHYSDSNIGASPFYINP